MIRVDPSVRTDSSLTDLFIVLLLHGLHFFLDLSFYLPIYLSIHLNCSSSLFCVASISSWVYLSILPIYLFYPSIYFTHLSIYLSIYLFLLYIHISIYLLYFTWLVHHPSAWPPCLPDSIYLFNTYLSIYLTCSSSFFCMASISSSLYWGT